LGLCDRILVLSEGRLAAELTREEATQERILAAATARRTAVAMRRA
jgi:ABC-type sugar transport system ATPase subunit